jgi:hypothetical protein
MLTSGATAFRNALIIMILAWQAALECVVPLGLMFAMSGILWKRYSAPQNPDNATELSLNLRSALISKMSADGKFKRQLMVALVLIAVAGLVGVGINHALRIHLGFL